MDEYEKHGITMGLIFGIASTDNTHTKSKVTMEVIERFVSVETNIPILNMVKMNIIVMERITRKAMNISPV